MAASIQRMWRSSLDTWAWVRATCVAYSDSTWEHLPFKLREPVASTSPGVRSEETDLSIIKIALYSGFRSIRQFNHAMRAAFDQSPLELRRSYKTPQTKQYRDGITLFVAYRPPFDWESLINFLRPRATPGVEVVGIRSYRRTIEINGELGEIEIRPDEAEPRFAGPG
jgi:hypothetical protein